MSRVTVNGRVREVRDGATVADLLSEIEASAEGLVVEINQEVISPETYGTTGLAEGDVVELVRFVGGG